MKALILVKTANKGTWKAKALARTINARRAKRGSRARISPYEMMIHKVCCALNLQESRTERCWAHSPAGAVCACRNPRTT